GARIPRCNARRTPFCQRGSTGGSSTSVRMKIGVIGMGNRGASLCKALESVDGAEVVLAADINPEFARNFMKERNLNVPLAVSKAELLKEACIDAVLVTTPDHCHFA